MEKQLDTSSLLVVAATLVLFVLALLTKGFTHDLLLEAGVFLVSVKLIIMGYRNGRSARELERRLDEIRDLLVAGRNAPG